jgi:hypothetical protein
VSLAQSPTERQEATLEEHTMTNDTRSRTHLAPSIHRAIPALVLSIAPLLAASATAQPLPAACSNGGPNYQPYGVAEFLAGDVGTPMLRHTLTGPDSQCNDGSPAILYIRPPGAFYSGSQLPQQVLEQERWVIVFDGGGACSDADGCLERWCGIPTYDRAGKMSTLGAYDAIYGSAGILSRNWFLNDFAGYNQVLLNYCSSDSLVGSESRVGVTPSAGPAYDIEFNGEAIVNDAFTQLLDLAGTAPDAGPAATFWNDSLPSLRTAEEIVLVGLSAGGNGLRHHLDRLEAWLKSAVISPDVRISGVIDAGMTPGLWGGVTWGAVAGAPSSYADYLTTLVKDRHDFWGTDDTAIDASCLDPMYAGPHNMVGVHPEICYDTTYSLLNHITTPFFARQDIHDTLGDDRYVDWLLYPGAPAFMAAQAAQLVATATLAGGLEPVTVTPGVSGTHCLQHVTVLTGDFFTDTPAFPAGGPVGLSFHDLLSNWLYGGPARQVQPDFNAGPVYTPSNC